MGFLSGKEQTSNSDLLLFKELGLRPFSTDDKKELFIGKVTTTYGDISIWVTCMPAQFWTFVIYCKESNKQTKFSTGSGNLRDFYSFAKVIMEGMIVIEAN